MRLVFAGKKKKTKGEKTKKNSQGAQQTKRRKQKYLWEGKQKTRDLILEYTTYFNCLLESRRSSES